MLVTLQPEIVIIDSGDEDPILVTQFQVEYAASSREVITTGTLLGTVDINVLFESNRVSFRFSIYFSYSGSSCWCT